MSTILHTRINLKPALYPPYLVQIHYNQMDMYGCMCVCSGGSDPHIAHF